MKTRSKSRILAYPPPMPGAVGRGRLPGSEGMMTRARFRYLGLADLPVPCAGSGPPRKQPRRDLAHPERPAGHSKASEWRDWANLTTELIEDIAGRLLSVHAAEYMRFRAVCHPWRAFTADPRAGGPLDSRFRPGRWTLFYPSKVKPHYSIYDFAKTEAPVDQQEHYTDHFLAAADGLIVLCNKANYVVRLFNRFTGARVEFPAITNVRIQDDAEANDRFLAMDALKGSISNPGVISRIAGIDDSTSPPSLVLCLRNGSSHVICAKPGDEHWVSLHPRGLGNGVHRVC